MDHLMAENISKIIKTDWGKSDNKKIFWEKKSSPKWDKNNHLHIFTKGLSKKCLIKSVAVLVLMYHDGKVFSSLFFQKCIYSFLFLTFSFFFYGMVNDTFDQVASKINQCVLSSKRIIRYKFPSLEFELRKNEEI